MRNFLSIFAIFLLLALSSFSLISCGGWDPASARKTPTRGIDRAKKNVEEGRGVSLRGLGKSGSTTYEFSTSNPMWRAAFDVIDFMPLVTVDYSGGTIITDWYTDQSNINQRCKLNIFIKGVEFKTDKAGLYIISINSRLGMHLLVELFSFSVDDIEGLYSEIYKFSQCFKSSLNFM